MLMLLEAWDGITPFPECGILKANNDHREPSPRSKNISISPSPDTRLQMVQNGIAKKKREIFSKWKHLLLSHVEKYQKMR